MVTGTLSSSYNRQSLARSFPLQPTNSSNQPEENNTPKAVTTKKTPARKYASKTPPDSAAESATPKTAETKRALAAKAKQAKNNEASPAEATPESNTEQSAVEEVKTSDDANLVAPETKVPSAPKPIVKRAAGKSKTPPSTKTVPKKTPKSGQAVNKKVEETQKKEESVDVKDLNCTRKEETAIERAGECIDKDQNTMEVEESSGGNVVKSTIEEQSTDKNVGESTEQEENIVEVEVPPTVYAEDALKQKETVAAEVAKLYVAEEHSSAKMGKQVEEELEEETKNVNDKEEPRIEAVNIEENSKDELRREDDQPEQEEYGGDEELEEYADRVDFEDPGEDDLAEDDGEELVEETDAQEAERRELTAIAKERRNKKEYEIFVGGLDRDAVEEDVRRVFEKIGDVIEVRLHRNLSTNKNKGYAFVKFADKEHAKRALAEMKNPVICGKRCGTAPSEDNDTLFLGNICNTWTKEAIRQKLKDYGIEGVENITLVPDVQHEGLSRGFAFLEFSCHADAMLAYKRLQKPDVVFGHPERTAKVAFAEPLREPDPEVMAQVKTVFLDGIPPQWDEDCVREQLKGYGELVRIVLARNMSTAKRKDFGFADFSTHEAAVACIDGINNKELSEGNFKTKVKARLSNPLPKTQAVKGGMCGGFRIGRVGSRNFSNFGRGFGRGGRNFNWTNFQHGRGFPHQGRGQTGRMGPNEYAFDNQYANFHSRQIIERGGRRGFFRGGHHASGRGVAVAGPSRSNFNRHWYNAPDRGHGEHIPPRRQPFSLEEPFDRPFVGRQFDDPYFFNEDAHGIKRPFYMMDQDPDYMEPSRMRPRLDYSDPAVPFRGTRYRDTYGTGSDPYSHDYYGPGYGSYPSYYGGDHSYGGGYYY